MRVTHIAIPIAMLVATTACHPPYPVDSGKSGESGDTDTDETDSTHAPSISWVQPSAAGGRFWADMDFDLAVDVTDPDGDLDDVLFYRDETYLLGTGTQSDTRFVLNTSLPEGTSTLRATASDLAGFTSEEDLSVEVFTCASPDRGVRYSFDGSTISGTTVLDLSGHDANGESRSEGDQGSAFVTTEGPFAEALDLSAGQDYLKADIGDLTDLGDEFMALMAWVQVADADSDIPIFAIGRQIGGSYVALRPGRVNASVGGVEKDGQEIPILHDTLAKGGWHHVAMVFDHVGDKFQVFADGVLAAESDLSRLQLEAGRVDLYLGSEVENEDPGPPYLQASFDDLVFITSYFDTRTMDYLIDAVTPYCIP